MNRLLRRLALPLALLIIVQALPMTAALGVGLEAQTPVLSGLPELPSRIEPPDAAQVLPQIAELARETTLASGPTGPWTAVAVGSGHTCAISGGGVWCWGGNIYGQIGDGTQIDRTVPVAVIGINNALAVSAGAIHTCALVTDGEVYCWGNLYSSVGLGAGSDTGSTTPVKVAGLRGVTAISAGGGHTCAMLNSAVRCWGANGNGQLGDGTTTNRLTPTAVVGLETSVVALAAGGNHTCAVLEGGALRCWGFNYAGELGDGTTTQRLTPVAVSGLDRDVQAVSAGEVRTCAVLVGGSVRCWGRRHIDHVTVTTPELILGLGNVVHIETSAVASCALLSDKSVRCWGENRYGWIGDSTTTNRPEPQPVRDLADQVQAIATGENHSCALLQDGLLRCWGANWRGQLGDGSRTHRSVPTTVLGERRGVIATATGYNHTCALTAEGRVFCWGSNYNGQLGDGTTQDRLKPVEVSGLGLGVQAISASYLHTCAITAIGALYCWGWNGSGQLGDGTTTQRVIPTPVEGLNSFVTAVSAGGSHTCAIRYSGLDVYCWGSNFYGQLGNGTTSNAATPQRVSTRQASDIAVSSWHTCIVSFDSTVWCWGNNNYSELGDGTSNISNIPVAVNVLGNPGSGAAAIALGYEYTCALLINADVRCWGKGSTGSLGIGFPVAIAEPTYVLSGAAHISAGGGTTCAILRDRSVRCWGANDDGQLGDGTDVNRGTPTQVSGLSEPIAAIKPSYSHTCAVAVAGNLYCWGDTRYGQIGDGSSGIEPLPRAVVGLNNASKVSSGHQHSCAINTDGGAVCWGYNGSGQLGMGSSGPGGPVVAVSALSSGVTDITAAIDHSCAVWSGRMYCWGSFAGIFTWRPQYVPLPNAARTVSATQDHTCTLDVLMKLWCWGSNTYGQLGLGTTTNTSSPQQVSAVGIEFTQVSAGVSHTCTTTANQRASCWGNNFSGQLATGGTSNGLAPQGYTSYLTDVKTISAGNAHSCAITNAGKVFCWGDNSKRQVGDGTLETRLTETEVVGLPPNIAAISAGYEHSCALTAGGAVWCWGDNAYGQLGDGTTQTRTAPVAVSGLSNSVVGLDAGILHTCAVLASGEVRCWGYNFEGQIGIGRPIRTAPVLILAPPTITAATPPAGSVGQPYSYTLSATGTPTPTLALSAGALPPGLSFAATSGTLSGTPTAAGSYPVTLTADNGVGSTEALALTLVVNGPGTAGPTLRPSGAAVGAPGSIFGFVGAGFPPGGTVDLAVNGLVVGAIPADASGGLAVALVFPASMAPGSYIVSATPRAGGAASLAAAAETTITLRADAPVYTDPSDAPRVNVPAPAADDHLVFLPLVVR